MTRDELLALADRCEAATGPDRDIDCWIENRLGLAKFVPDCPAPQGEGWLDKRVDPKPYTASLDAAMTLVPDAMTWSVDQGPSHWILMGTSKPAGRAQVYRQADYGNGDPDQVSEHGFAATPALALTAAALRAKASQ